MHSGWGLGCGGLGSGLGFKAYAGKFADGRCPFVSGFVLGLFTRCTSIEEG